MYVSYVMWNVLVMSDMKCTCNVSYEMHFILWDVTYMQYAIWNVYVIRISLCHMKCTSHINDNIMHFIWHKCITFHILVIMCHMKCISFSLCGMWRTLHMTYNIYTPQDVLYIHFIFYMSFYMTRRIACTFYIYMSYYMYVTSHIMIMKYIYIV